MLLFGGSYITAG